jgi:hypothetical protein
MCVCLTIEDAAPSPVLPEAIAKRAVEIEPGRFGFSVQPVHVLGSCFLFLSSVCLENMQVRRRINNFTLVFESKLHFVTESLRTRSNCAVKDCAVS